MNIFKRYVVLVSFFAIGNVSFAQDTIHWRTDYKLKWTDFKGIPESNSNVKALSSLEIEYQVINYQNVYYWELKTVFKKSSSWTMLTTSSNLLSHEQRHFDIAEIYARKISKAFTTIKDTVTEERLDSIFSTLQKEYEDAQLAYDKETNLSMNPLGQKKWSQKIDMELKVLAIYANKKGKVTGR